MISMFLPLIQRFIGAYSIALPPPLQTDFPLCFLTTCRSSALFKLKSSRTWKQDSCIPTPTKFAPPRGCLFIGASMHIEAAVLPWMTARLRYSLRSSIGSHVVRELPRHPTRSLLESPPCCRMSSCVWACRVRWLRASISRH